MSLLSRAPLPVDRTPFDRWLWARDITNAQAAARLGCAGETVRRYRLPFGDDGRRIPDEATMAEIFAWTEGEITPNDFHRVSAAPAQVSSAAGGDR